MTDLTFDFGPITVADSSPKPRATPESPTTWLARLACIAFLTATAIAPALVIAAWKATL